VWSGRVVLFAFLHFFLSKELDNCLPISHTDLTVCTLANFRNCLERKLKYQLSFNLWPDLFWIDMTFKSCTASPVSCHVQVITGHSMYYNMVVVYVAQPSRVLCVLVNPNRRTVWHRDLFGCSNPDYERHSLLFDCLHSLLCKKDYRQGTVRKSEETSCPLPGGSLLKHPRNDLQHLHKHLLTMKKTEWLTASLRHSVVFCL